MLIPTIHKGALSMPDGARIPWATIGDGAIPVVYLAGSSEGVANIAESPWWLALFLRRRQSTFRLLLLGLRQPIPPVFTVDYQARDAAWALDQLGWGPTLLECYSALGPLGQRLAVERPELARGLVLNSTFARVDAHVERLLRYWHDLALRGHWSEYYWSVTALMLRPATVERLRLFRCLTHLLPRPKDPLALARLFEGLLGLDQRDLLGRITCPTLVIGGAEDRIVPAGLQSELAALIPASRLMLYPGYGHGLGKEHPDCEVQTTRFMAEAWRMHGYEPSAATRRA